MIHSKKESTNKYMQVSSDIFKIDNIIYEKGLDMKLKKICA